jgi:[acyl-carrier-protein] S-malonyltransferase
MIRAGLLFPGQGAQWAGMGADLYRESVVFRHMFDGVCQATGMDLGDVCFLGTRIDETALTQPAIYAVSVSILAVLLEMGVVPERCAGLSLGEYGALTCAGVFDPFTGAKLEKRRGELMGALDGTGGLAAIAGLTEDEVEALRARYFEGRRLYIANRNLPTSRWWAVSRRCWNRSAALRWNAGPKSPNPFGQAGPSIRL